MIIREDNLFPECAPYVYVLVAENINLCMFNVPGTRFVSQIVWIPHVHPFFLLNIQADQRKHVPISPKLFGK